MPIIKKGTFSKNHANVISGADMVVKCFACKKDIVFDSVDEDTPSSCPYCGCKDIRICMEDSCACVGVTPEKKI